MGSQDKSLRPAAIPYYGQIMKYNRSESSDIDVSSAVDVGDLANIIGAVSQKDYMIRILRPQYAHIIQAYLNISLTFDSTEPSPKFYVSAGSGYGTDGVSAVVPSQAYILAAHQRITGQSAPLSGQAGQPLTFYKLNIQPLIPQVGQTNYNQDSYVIGIHFLQAPVQTGLWHLQKLFVTGSVTVIP